MADGDTEPVKQVPNKAFIENQWKPGQSGNPHGRPRKELSITDTMRDMLNAKPEIKQALSAKLFELALKGDLAAIREIVDRLEGKPMFKAEVTNLEPPKPILGGDVPTNPSDQETEETH